MKSERQSLQHGNNFTHHGSALQRWATFKLTLIQNTPAATK